MLWGIHNLIPQKFVFFTVKWNLNQPYKLVISNGGLFFFFQRSEKAIFWMRFAYQREMRMIKRDHGKEVKLWEYIFIKVSTQFVLTPLNIYWSGFNIYILSIAIKNKRMLRKCWKTGKSVCGGLFERFRHTHPLRPPTLC